MAGCALTGGCTGDSAVVVGQTPYSYRCSYQLTRSEIDFRLTRTQDVHRKEKADATELIGRNTRWLEGEARKVHIAEMDAPASRFQYRSEGNLRVRL